ncbi:MAG TPA: glycosyltransferase [Candidatus Limnocylindria bacterium]|nr:glycosyltransferase [Candidatus Limnocylindria bacterium]
MRVLYVIHGPVFGGAHNQALRLRAPLEARGVETIVVLPSEPGNAVDRLRRGGVRVVTIPLHRVRATVDPRVHLRTVAGLIPEVHGLRRLIREREVDVVQIGGLVNPHGAIAARREGVPVVWQLLDTRAPPPVAFGAMLAVRALATVIMPTGSRVLAAFPGAERLRGRTVPFIPPVDTDAFRPRPELRATLRADWGIPDGAPVVGSIGNLNPQKGYETLVRAFARVRERMPDARLVIVGSEHGSHAGYARRVRALVDALATAEGASPVTFLGPRTDVDRLLAGFDVLALASVPRSEGIPTAALEAMASAVPVVATDVGGVREVVEDGVTGSVVPALDPRSLAAAVVELLSEPSRRSEMAVESRRRAEERFSLDRCAETHLRAYRMALSRGAGRR